MGRASFTLRSGLETFSFFNLSVVAAFLKMIIFICAAVPKLPKTNSQVGERFLEL